MKSVVLVLCFVEACFAASIGSGASCPLICTADYNPVCGSNGRTYSNRCELTVAQCHNPTVTLSHPGKCTAGSGTGLPTNLCPNIMCIALWDPVCGSDGVTYGNSCELHAKNCGSHHVTKAHDGACGSISIG